MESFFSDEELNNMSRENLIELMKVMKEQKQKQEMEIQLLKDKQKELEFLNALLSDRLTLAQRKQFGVSSEKYADGYEQMHLFNEAETNADADANEPSFEEIHPSSYRRKKHTGKKEEDLSVFEITETKEYKLEGEARHCSECGKKYNVVTKEAALTALKRDFTKEQLKETVAYQAMERIGILYKIEELIRDKTVEERYEERQKQSKPILDALFDWLHTIIFRHW